MRWLALALLVSGALTYANTLSAPFLFDDQPSIVDNPYIRALWPPWTLIHAPQNTITTARPLVSLSLALNYAMGALDVRGYHVVNIAVHLLATLALFGVVRRTLLVERLRSRFADAATPLAFVSALLWMLHPVQTESVNYISQRTESMMGLFYFLTLYGAIRAAGTSNDTQWRWSVASALACAAGTMSKQVIVTAPVVVVLWDWVFLSKPFRRILAERWTLYVSLASTWLLLGLLMWAFQDTNVLTGGSAWDYTRAQGLVILGYLRRSVWPTGLQLDYGPPVPISWSAAAPGVAGVLLLLSAAAVALWRAPAMGFLASSFFIVLAPTSSVVALATEVGAERRMYVPLASLVVLVVTAGYALLERRPHQAPGVASTDPPGVSLWQRHRGAVALTAVIACSLAALTVRRNALYAAPVNLWTSAVTQMPDNWRARNNLGVALEAAGQADEAVAEYRRALELNPRHGPAHYNLAKALHARGMLDEAIAHYRAIADVEPTAAVCTDLGVALGEQGRADEAVARFKQALQLDPTYADAHMNLGRTLFARGETEPAALHYSEAIRLAPGDARARVMLGTALATAGKTEEAIREYRRALEISPELAAARVNLGTALLSQGQTDAAIAEYRQVMSLGGTDGEDARRLLARAFATQGKFEEATAEYRRVFESAADPRVATAARHDFADMLLAQQRLADAVEQYRIVAQRLPGNPRVHFSLGIVLGLSEQHAESLSEFEQAVRLAPEWPEALVQLANALLTQPRPSPDDRARAVTLAERAASLTARKNSSVLRALAFVYSATGQPPLAERVMREIEALESNGLNRPGAPQGR